MFCVSLFKVVFFFISLTMENVTVVHAGNYRCAARNYGGNVTSMNMTLHVGGMLIHIVEGARLILSILNCWPGLLQQVLKWKLRWWFYRRFYPMKTWRKEKYEYLEGRRPSTWNRKVLCMLSFFDASLTCLFSTMGFILVRLMCSTMVTTWLLVSDGWQDVTKLILIQQSR